MKLLGGTNGGKSGKERKKIAIVSGYHDRMNLTWHSMVWNSVLLLGVYVGRVGG